MTDRKDMPDFLREDLEAIAQDERWRIAKEKILDEGPVEWMGAGSDPPAPDPDSTISKAELPAMLRKELEDRGIYETLSKIRKGLEDLETKSTAQKSKNPYGRK